MAGKEMVNLNFTEDALDVESPQLKRITLVLPNAVPNGIIQSQENPSRWTGLNPLVAINLMRILISLTSQHCWVILMRHISLTPWLEYRFLYGANYGTGNRKAELQGWIKGTGGDAPAKGAAAVLNNTLFSQTITHTLNFTKDLSDKFNLNAVAGYEYWKTSYQGSGTSVYEFNYNLQQTGRVPITLLR
jgi:hypothetical protein